MRMDVCKILSVCLCMICVSMCRVCMHVSMCQCVDVSMCRCVNVSCLYACVDVSMCRCVCVYLPHNAIFMVATRSHQQDIDQHTSPHQCQTQHNETHLPVCVGGSATYISLLVKKKNLRNKILESGVL